MVGPHVAAEVGTAAEAKKYVDELLNGLSCHDTCAGTICEAHMPVSVIREEQGARANNSLSKRIES